MAKIRHIAIKVEDQEKAASFYKETFGMTEAWRGPARDDGKRAIYLTDGYINMAILPARGGREGIDHFGFQVENIESTQERLRQIEPGIEIVAPHDSVTFAEYKLKDPDGNPFDISEKGWAV